ncbi:SDR family oxidoreductase [Microvirga sp. BT689]|uniref:SDR family NAD(P)-dependent oxidoreductase n=1 Tax=Microvirga arvi TaxID=2778731 RepID=UPI00194DEDC6|nr:SDR family oxidoreductase [Microvirga arvi]MBM6581867.1 SDR family oxidoreductase [Microvirga arvi]
MKDRLAGKVAVVTGAARGIGRAVATEFAAHGARVYALDRLGDEVATLPGVEAMRMDLADANEVAATFARIQRNAGQIDILVNNAGIIFFKPVEETSVEDWDRLQAVNLRGPFLCVRAVAPGMKARRAGAIINVSSNAGVRGGNDESAYCASKFGIEGFSRALAVEFAPYNVSVNTITPGHPVHTAMSETTYDAEKRKIWKDPRELAPAFVHLACQDASGLNDRHVRAWDLVVELRQKGIAA